jgi:hypothetical protein
MPEGELIFANVLDVRQRAAEGDMANGVVSILASPGRALPFAVLRDWKAPTGYLSEEIELIAPSGRRAHLVGPAARFMYGSMDVTHLETVVDDAVLEEVGGYVASFLLEGEVIGQTDFQVTLGAPPAKLPQPYEDGLKRSDVIWVGIGSNGAERMVPAWFVYRNGRVLVLSALEPGPAEQSVPGIPGADEVVIVTRRKGRDTALERFRAAARVLEGEEWEQAAIALADRRRDRHGPPADAIDRWRSTCAIAELTPLVGG